MSDVNTLISNLTKDNTLVKQLFGVDAPLPYSSVRRKAELKRREDIFRKQLLRKKQSERIKRKYLRREKTRLKTQKCRRGNYGYLEKINYYESLEKSYWYYLRKKYGKHRILSLEEFEEHIAPRYKPGFNILARRDKSRNDWFLDNIEVVNADSKRVPGRGSHSQGT